MRRVAAVTLGVLATFVLAAPAQAVFERIGRYDVAIVIEDDGSLTITETIAYDFGTTPRHGIIREIPTTLRYDDTYDREYPLTVLSVTATGDASADYTIEHPGGGVTAIKVGDPDRTISGRHTYEIRYRVEGALNGFPDHVELYWNAIGDEWDVPIGVAKSTVTGPAAIQRVACYAGYQGSTTPCDKATADGTVARFTARDLPAFGGMTVVVSLPKGSVPTPTPVLVERWSPTRAFAVTPATGAASGGLLVVAVGGIGFLIWRTGRDRRWRGGQVDQVMGNPTGEAQSVPLFEGGASAPVEFAPPENLRPGQIGTLLDERANTLDVTASIVDLAVRGYLLIQEIPKEGLFGKPDWTLIRLEKADDDLLTYERKLLNGLFEDGTEVTLSSLRNTFAARLKGVEESLYVDAVTQGWFTARPDKVRTSWNRRGWLLLLAGIGLTFVLARWTHWGIVGIPVIVAGLLLVWFDRFMPARTPKGTATLRRVRGFRTVIETAETHMSRWAEEENVFPRFLPFAIVFGVTEKWAKAFEGLAREQDTSWYLSPRPFVYADFADSMDGFAVSSGGMLASVPAASGSSGFGGGGFSGGGGGGGGGGSW
ncbi:MAG: DUF2207 domain-containing protein [Actinomycetota bacterium]